MGWWADLDWPWLTTAGFLLTFAMYNTFCKYCCCITNMIQCQQNENRKFRFSYVKRCLWMVWCYSGEWLTLTRKHETINGWCCMRRFNHQTRAQCRNHNAQHHHSRLRGKRELLLFTAQWTHLTRRPISCCLHASMLLKGYNGRKGTKETNWVTF